MQVVRFEQEGRLHPRRENGRVWYDGDEVAELVRTWRRKRAKHLRLHSPMVISSMRAAAARRVYQLFKEGKSDVDVVIESGFDPALVAQLRDDFDLTPAARRARVDAERRDAQERAAQRAHERARRDDAYQELQLKKARIAAEATVKAAEIQARGLKRQGGT